MLLEMFETERPLGLISPYFALDAQTGHYRCQCKVLSSLGLVLGC